MAEKEVKGAVYSMVEFNGKLLASINSTVSPPSGLSLRPPSTEPGSRAFSPSGLGLSLTPLSRESGSRAFSELRVCPDFKGSRVASTEDGPGNMGSWGWTRHQVWFCEALYMLFCGT